MSDALHGFGERRVRFVEEVADGDVVLLRFRDPRISYAILSEGAAGDDVLEVIVAGVGSGLSESGGVFVRYRGVELAWRPGYAVLQCEAEQAAGLAAAVIEFAFYERELRRIESEIAGAWTEVEQDKRLAFEVTVAQLQRGELVGGRMEQALERRIRMARMEARLFTPAAALSAPGQKLGEELREKAGIEARVEVVDGQLEVFEHVYEMAGQRMGEFRAARESLVVEWVIVGLLVLEAGLMAAQVIWRVR